MLYIAFALGKFAKLVKYGWVRIDCFSLMKIFLVSKIWMGSESMYPDWMLYLACA